MRHINSGKAALSVGTVIGLYHLAWTTLVAAGWAKPFMDFVLRLHFVEISYELSPFSFSAAAMLIALTFSIGAAFGLIFALVWNWLAFRSGDPRAGRGTQPAGGDTA